MTVKKSLLIEPASLYPADLIVKVNDYGDDPAVVIRDLEDDVLIHLTRNETTELAKFLASAVASWEAQGHGK